MVFLIVSVKILQPLYFTNGVVSLWMGFIRTKRVKDGFARYLLCRMDLQVAIWGLKSLHKQWKSAEHKLLDIKYRFQHDKPLVNKSCKDASKKECEWQKALVVGMAPMHLDSTFACRVAQMLDAENELEEGGKANLVTQLLAGKL